MALYARPPHRRLSSTDPPAYTHHSPTAHSNPSAGASTSTHTQLPAAIDDEPTILFPHPRRDADVSVEADWSFIQHDGTGVFRGGGVLRAPLSSAGAGVSTEEEEGEFEEGEFDLDRVSLPTSGIGTDLESLTHSPPPLPRGMRPPRRSTASRPGGERLTREALRRVQDASASTSISSPSPSPAAAAEEDDELDLRHSLHALSLPRRAAGISTSRRWAARASATASSCSSTRRRGRPPPHAQRAQRARSVPPASTGLPGERVFLSGLLRRWMGVEEETLQLLAEASPSSFPSLSPSSDFPSEEGTRTPRPGDTTPTPTLWDPDAEERGVRALARALEHAQGAGSGRRMLLPLPLYVLETLGLLPPDAVDPAPVGQEGREGRQGGEGAGLRWWFWKRLRGMAG